MTAPVSRETPPAPELARGVFSQALPLAESFAALLAGPGVVRGLIGPREAPRLWERHLLNCAVLADVVPGEAAVCDIGSGAGLPGLVLALRRPDLQVTLVEPLLRRTRFLDEAVDELALENVEIVRARAEALHGRRVFDVVTSRAVAPLDRLLGWSLPLTRAGGFVLAMKGASVREELDAAAGVMRSLQAGAVEVLTVGAGLLPEPTTALRVESTRTVPLRSSDRTDTATRSGRSRSGARPTSGERSGPTSEPRGRAAKRGR